MDIEQLLRQGIAAAKAGKREEARQALMHVVEADERSEQAWLWLSGVVDEPSDQRICLENVLQINPNNTRAQQGLQWLNARQPPADEHQTPTPGEQSTTADQVAATTTVTPQKAEVYASPLPPAEPTRSPPPDQPARVLSYDGTTPLALRPKDPVPPPPTLKAVSEEYLCPYCGAPTSPTQRACTQCHNDLMVRVEPREERSVALTILGILWGLSGALVLLAGLGILGLAVVSAFVPATPESGPVQITLWVLAVVVLIFGGLYIGFARGLFQRRRWAYIVNVIFVALGLIMAPFSIIQNALLAREIATQAASAGAPPEIASTMSAVIGTATLCNFAFVLLYVVLTVLSYRDFWGPKRRFLAEIPVRDDLGHYNAGVAYKKRGMWHLAAKEWQAAVKKNADDANYRHALGLAYAQLKQPDRALATLREALTLAPNDARIQESIALVEQRATKKE